MKVVLAMLLTLSAFTASAQTPPVGGRPPDTVDLLWSADTYTPPFYLGRALPSSQSQITVVALPSFGTVENITFNWIKDGRNIGSASGKGKNVLVYTAEATGRGNDIRVTATDTVGRSVAGQLFLPVIDPRVVVYEDDALLGKSYHQAITATYNLGKPEVTFLAEPYYFSSADVKNKRLEFDWRLNNRKVITDASDQRLATFAAPEEGRGENLVTIGTKNLSNPLQSAIGRLVIKFNQLGFSF